MSKVDRDLAREAAFRARQRKAGCPDPKCHVCDEGCIWRLVLSRHRPICANCLADSRRDPSGEAEMLERFRQVGFPDPRCVGCGEDKIWRLELDHIAGQKHDKDGCVPLCKNCHMERSFMQSREPEGGEDPTNIFEVIGRWLTGLAALFVLLAEKLYEFGEFLIELAKQGYGADLKSSSA
jgi:hypothetical protein